MSNIVIKGLNKKLNKVEILKDINMCISTGVFGLLGENGAGKTTLMRILSTVLKPDSGSINYEGLNWQKNCNDIRKIIGYLPQDFGVFDNITILECLKYIASLKGLYSRKAGKNIYEALEKVNLLQHKNKKIKQLSGGMKRRVGVAQSLLNNPIILIVDEPTAGLDPQERIRFRQLICNLAKESTIVLSTHIVEDIVSTCTKGAIMKRGKALQFNNISDIADYASNKIWSVTIHKDQYKDFNISEIISMNSNNNTITIRVLSNKKPYQNALLVKPTIEEGYLVWNKSNG